VFQMLCGAIAMGNLAIGVFFLGHWRTTGDRLFLAFGVAFGMLTLQRVAVGLLDPMHENTLPAHLLRLLAYITIAWAILDKNRLRKPRLRTPGATGTGQDA
jgi:hypothetical protein